jgi:hypothetical protein
LAGFLLKPSLYERHTLIRFQGISAFLYYYKHPCMAQDRGPWLSDGWEVNYNNGEAQRIVGELHRGPETPPEGVEPGWSDRNLAIYLRDYSTPAGSSNNSSSSASSSSNDARLEELRSAKTRHDLLVLCDKWDVPYLPQREWERSLDTAVEWFHVLSPVTREVGASACPLKVVVFARLEDVKAWGAPNQPLEGLWDWQDNPASSEGWVSASEGIMVRPRVLPPGTRLLHVNAAQALKAEAAQAQEHSDVAILEFEASRKLVMARQLVGTIEGCWGLRRHNQVLTLDHLSLGDETAPLQTTYELQPSDRLRDITARALLMGYKRTVLSLRLTSRDWSCAGEGEIEMRILSILFNSTAAADQHTVTQLLWREPIEGATHQVAVAAEMLSCYSATEFDLDSGVERVYALLDTRSGTVISCIVHPHPGAAAKVAAVLYPPGPEGAPRETPMSFQEVEQHLLYTR